MISNENHEGNLPVHDAYISLHTQFICLYTLNTKNNTQKLKQNLFLGKLKSKYVRFKLMRIIMKQIDFNRNFQVALFIHTV